MMMNSWQMEVKDLIITETVYHDPCSADGGEVPGEGAPFLNSVHNYRMSQLQFWSQTRNVVALVFPVR